MDLFDKLGSILPFLIFALITILGNLGDKKKPKVKVKTKPFPKGQKLPDIKPPASQEQDSIQLEVEPIPAPIPQPDQLGQEKAKQGGKLMGVENLSLAQAILSAEILGQPRCREIILLQKRKDWCINEISIYCGTCV